MDKALQREQTRERVKRYREKHSSVTALQGSVTSPTPESVTKDGALHSSVTNPLDKPWEDLTEEDIGFIKSQLSPYLVKDIERTITYFDRLKSGIDYRLRWYNAYKYHVWDKNNRVCSNVSQCLTGVNAMKEYVVIGGTRFKTHYNEQ